MKPLPAAIIASHDEHGVGIALEGGASLDVRVLEPSLLRVTLRPAAGYREPRTWAIAPTAGQDVAWSGRERDDLTGFSRPAAEVQVRNGAASLRTDALTVQVSAAPLALSWFDAEGRPLLADRSSAPYMLSQRTGALRHYLQRDIGERYYGLGDKTGPLDLHGRRLRTLALDALGYDPRDGDPLYKHWPFVLARSNTGGWYGLYYDTLAACTFDLGCEHDNYYGLYRYVEIDDGDLDYYLMTGATPGAVIAQFVRLIGGTHLPPRWSLGFAQTAMGLADADDAQDQLKGFIERTRDEQLPISAFHYGSGYSSRGKRRYVFTWNNAKFPDPRQLNEQFHAQGIRLVANVKPCLLDDHPAYAEVLAQGGFVHDAGSGQPVLEQFWDGIGSHLDFTEPAAIAWWQRGLRSSVLDFGIDAGWNDNNEYGIMDDAAQCRGFGQSLAMHRARPLHALLMTRATFEAQQQELAARGIGEAVFTVSRAGPPGIQRYAQTWSGDNNTSWRTLRWNLRTGLQMSLSGLFNVGHDVGGFAGPAPDPELLVRWVQACCLNPRMVMNSWKQDGSVTLPWMHPQVTHHVLAAIRLRYILLPYLGSLFERASQHHEPIIRPTFCDFPDDQRCYQDSDDFMLGSHLLVAPVVTPAAVTRVVYLPHGPPAWIDFHSGRRCPSGTVQTVDAPLSMLPLFVCAGAALPLAQGRDGRHQHDDPVTELRRFD